MHSLAKKECVHSLRKNFENELKKLLDENATLENYHSFVEDDDQHIQIQYKMVKFVIENQLHLDLFRENREWFESLIGLDMDIQVEPHLRIARPNKPQDNIGFHYDLSYGPSAYEISCIFNFTELASKAAIQVLPNSHAQPRLKTHPVNNPEVEKGSIKHQLGIPYLFHLIDDESYKKKMVPIPMEIGEVLVFDLGIIHGQEVNASEVTRWSIDSRLKNRFFVETGVRNGYYKSLFQSPVTQAGLKHYAANPKL